MALSENQEALKREFISVRGYWHEFWDGLLELSPELFEAYVQFSSVPWKKGHLTPKFKEFVYIAIDASTTHLYEPGWRVHIQRALSHGATQHEIMEVYELVSTLGMHTCTTGVPILLDELESAGIHVDVEDLTPEQERVKEEFISIRGYWDEFWDGLLKLSPELFAAYLEFSTVPWKKGYLTPKEKELIYIAIDAATTHLYEPGWRVHIRQALTHGATKEEIMEVYELVSTLGMHTCTTGVPLLLEELAGQGTET